MDSKPSLSSLIGRVRELDKAATEAPWEVKFSEYGGYDCMTDAFKAGPIWIDLSDYGQQRGRHENAERSEAGVRAKADADMVAESRTLLVQLADAAERMQEQNRLLMLELPDSETGLMPPTKEQLRARVAELEGADRGSREDRRVGRGLRENRVQEPANDELNRNGRVWDGHTQGHCGEHIYISGTDRALIEERFQQHLATIRARQTGKCQSDYHAHGGDVDGVTVFESGFMQAREAITGAKVEMDCYPNRHHQMSEYSEWKDIDNGKVRMRHCIKCSMHEHSYSLKVQVISGKPFAETTE